MTWETLVINSEEIRQQADDMIRALQEEHREIQEAMAGVGSIQEADTLQGQAWQKLKEGSKDYLLILQGLLCANESMMADSQRLRNLAGEQKFYGEDVSAAILYANRMIDTYRDRLEELNRMKHAAQNLNIPIWWIDDSIRSADRVIQSAEHGRAVCMNQIEMAEYLAGSTTDLYQESEQLYAAVEQGLTSLELGNSVSLAGDSVPAWVQTVQQAWDKRKEKLEVQSKEYLKGEGFTEEQLNVMKELGYGYAEVKDLWLELPNEQDRDFFQYLMGGTAASYAEAFGINPMELSDEMTLVLADYAYRLLPKNLSLDISQEELQRLVDFNNAILAENHAIMDSNGTALSITYGDLYLEKLCIGSTMQVQGELVFLTSLNPEEDEEAYDILYGAYEKKFALMNLWTTESLLIQELNRKQEGGAVGLNISDLRMSQWNADFTLNHLYNGRTESECVGTRLVKMLTGIDQQQDSERIEEARKAHDEAIQNGIIKTIKGTCMIALTTFCPEMAIVVDLELMAMEGEITNINGLDCLVDNRYAKLGIKGGNTVLAGAANTYIDYLNTGKNFEQVKYQKKMEWFGMGYTYNVTEGILYGDNALSVCGVYNPEIIRKVEGWNREGLRSFTDWNAHVEKDSNIDVYVELTKVIESDEGTEEITRENALILLNGGGDILDMDFEEFLKAVEYIEFKGGGSTETEEIITAGGILKQWLDTVE